METTARTKITISASINAPIEEVWKRWTHPEDIVGWNHASDDWHTPRAENDLSRGGHFNYRMEARDGSFGFDFSGVYDLVIINKQIDYTLDDDRIVKILFTAAGDQTEITETFEAEGTNAIELQRFGWQSILDNFKKYAEVQQL